MMKRLLVLVLLALPHGSNAEQSFPEYLDTIREQALDQGIDEATIDAAFENLEPDPRVIKFDRRQPEFVQTFEEYLTARVSDFRQREGKRLFKEHRALLKDIENAYDVDAEYIVAIWGLETSFGRYQGKYSIVRSLATLGHDPRRSAFFTRELLNALQILDEGHVDSEQFVGAWAGAMGQSQFMPSSFLNFAMDHDGDGRKDIWANESDVFASIANYLAKAGWQLDAGWGAEVTVESEIDWMSLKPETYDTSCRGLRHHTTKMSLDAWREKQIASNNDLVEQPYAVIIPQSGDEPVYLAGGNFRAIMRYNCANKYAVSVGLLANIIAKTP